MAKLGTKMNVQATPRPVIFPMETIGLYTPLTPGRNTIRMLSAKYDNIKPGDIIRMKYRIGEEIFGEETVTVRSTHVASLDTICLAHGKDNHGFHMQTRGLLRDFLRQCYGETESSENLFIAIYV